jgi:hypothetical protein
MIYKILNEFLFLKNHIRMVNYYFCLWRWNNGVGGGEGIGRGGTERERKNIYSGIKFFFKIRNWKIILKKKFQYNCISRFFWIFCEILLDKYVFLVHLISFKSYINLWKKINNNNNKKKILILINIMNIYIYIL